MTSRRRFIQVCAVGAIAPTAFAQRRPVKVGMLSPRPLAKSFFTPAVVQRLGELGYRAGDTMVLEYRSADDRHERFGKLARELIDAKCDVIFAVGTQHGVMALRDARTSIPVVFYANEFDPVEKGVVKSLGRPGTNFTGLYVPQDALSAKRLELLRETVPAVGHVLTFSDPFTQEQLIVVKKAAALIGVRLTAVEFTGLPYDFEAAFEAARKAKVDAFLMLSSPAFATTFASSFAMIEKNRLPSIGATVFSERGLLLGYGPHPSRGGRRIADMGVRILEGASPADIPVEQESDFELVVNAKTAKALGVKLPESIRARAIRVVS
jgi:putative ABC transport system substrate-binding protein